MPSGHAKRKRLVHKAPPKIDSVRNEINVTPLVDVVLVLLIIFLVILPMLERGKNVPLPETAHHISEKDSRQPIVVIDRGGTIYVDKLPVKDQDEMERRVREEWEALAKENQSVSEGADNVDQESLRKGEGRVLVKSDPTLSYGKVYPIVLRLHHMGATGIDLGTNELRQSGEAEE